MKRVLHLWLNIALMALACITFRATANHPQPSSVNAPLLKFNHLTLQHSLNQNTVTKLFTDQAGMLWVGTQDGLHSYNGKSFHLFSHNANDPTSISEGFVTDISQDHLGQLWIGTYNNGLNRFDLTAGTFTRYNQNNGLLDLRINRLANLGDTLWIGTQSGLYSLSLTGNTLQKVPLGNTITPNIKSLSNVGGNYLMVGTESDGLFVIGPDSIHRPNLPQSLSANQIKAIDSTRVFVALSNELWVYDIEGRHGKKIWQREGQKNKHEAITEFAVGPDKAIWLVGDNSGLINLQPAATNPLYPPLGDLTNTPEINAFSYRHDPLLEHSLIENNIQSLLVDDNGILWVGTSFSGLDKVNIGQQYFSHLYEYHQLAPRQSNNIRSLFKDNNDTLWVGMDGAGVKSLTPGNQFYRHFRSELLYAAGISDHDTRVRVLDIAQTKNGHLWFASNLGLATMNTEGDFRIYPQSDSQEGAIANGLIRSIHVDEQDRLWASSHGRLFQYRPDIDAFEEFDFSHIAEFYPDRNQILVIRSNKEGLWLGTMNGLVKLNTHTKEGGVFKHQPHAESESIIDNRIRDILFAQDGSIWLASLGGLSHLAPRGEHYQISNYSSELNLPSTTTYALLEDEKQQLWFSSNAGISRFDPVSKQTMTFHEFEGLQGLEFNGSVKMLDSDGQMWFGGINGINHFYPARMPSSRKNSKLALSGYSIAGNYTRIFDLTRPPALTLDYNDQVVSFEVTGLNYNYTDNDTFAFKLDGIEEQWHFTESTNKVTYTNLVPGHYTLQVRHGIKYNPPSEQILEIPFAVKAPFYRTNIAYLLYILATAAIILRVITSNRKRRQRQHEFDTSIRTSEERLKLALWASGDGMWDWNIKANTIFKTDAKGNHPSASSQASILDEVHPEDRKKADMALKDHLKGRTAFYEAEYRTRNERGEWVWLLVRGKVVEYDDHSQPLRMTGTQKDITHRKKNENELRLSSQVLHSMNEAVVVAGLDYKIISVNPAFSKITGLAADNVINKPFLYLTRNLFKRKFYHAVEKQLLHHKHWAGEITIRTNGKQNILIWLEINQVIDSKQEASHFVAVFTDITERKKAEEDLRVLASYDTLTGLPNRTLFQDRLTHAIHHAHRSGHIVALLFLDLDRFKHINDSMGHHIGDLLLQAVANRLKNAVREGDTVARLGGDEFTIILEGASKNKVATVIAEKLIQTFQTPFLLDDKVLTISPSIGISVYPDDAQDSTSLIKYADTAMYHAKSLGRNNFQFYTTRLNEYAIRHVELEAGLKQAIARNEFSLVYQPKFCVATGVMTGVEALIRWHSKELGFISPAEFIPMAEETGMINQIGQWVIHNACHQIANWHEQGFTSLNVAVNLSANQLKDDIVSTIEVALAVSGLPAHALELELTESMIMKKPQDSVSVLNQLKSLGLTLAVDDFGTGYSSLSYLKRFPIDTLKIDREFVRDITDDPEDAAITSAIIALGHSLDLQVVAEGVETQEQLNFLANNDCDMVQGYLLSKPLDATTCQAFLQQQKTNHNLKSLSS